MRIKNYINYNYLFLFMASVVNLLFMHYQILLTISLESECFKSSPFDNLIACLLDVTVLFLLSMLITWKKYRVSLVITFIITLLWSNCNVFYTRFFQQYLSLSSIGQAGNHHGRRLVQFQARSELYIRCDAQYFYRIHSNRNRR